VPPSLDDEFAKDVGFQTLIELRADVHTKLEKAYKDRAETLLAHGDEILSRGGALRETAGDLYRVGALLAQEAQKP
jgi:hypothetical protein